MHALALLLRAPRFLVRVGAADDFLLLAAALGHDAGHRGFTSAFEIAARSPLALAHGGEGPVLERMHASAAAAALTASGALGAWPPASRAAGLGAVVAAILATDMAQHDRIVSEVAGARAAGAGVLAPPALAAALIHAADLSNPILPAFSTVYKWAAMVCDEFTQQVTREQAAGYPFAPHMVGLSTPQAVAKLQLGFVDYVVSPLWVAIATALPELAGPTPKPPLPPARRRPHSFPSPARLGVARRGAFRVVLPGFGGITSRPARL
jgi:hypothetical protein